MQINGKSVAAAYVKARAAIGATVTKDARANYGRYATLAAVMEAITPALSANGLALVQEAILDEAAVVMQAAILHESGETIEFVPLTMPLGNIRTPQAVGSAMTYGRRYQLTALFGLAPDDDDGEAASQRHGEAASKSPQERTQSSPTAKHTAPHANARPSASTLPTVQMDDAPPVDEDGPFIEEPEPVDDATLKRLHAIGTAVYGADWDGKRHELIGALTKGRTHSSKDLTLVEARRMCAGIEAKQAIMQQPDYQARQRTAQPEAA